MKNKTAVAGAVCLALTLGSCGGGGGHDEPVASVDPVLASIQSVPTIKEIPFESPSPARCPTTSHPFNTMLCSVGASLNYDADGTSPVDLQAAGYTEKEFFQSGNANVYDLGADQRAVVHSSGNAYTTRLMVRYPTDPAKFSGRVFVEIYNASNNYDVENTWRRAWKHMIRSGDAFIGITSKSVSANALKKFDATRYAALNWQVAGKDENGLFWDMLSQLATLLRQPDAKVLGTLKAKYLYLTGESQSGMYMNTYLTAFSDRVENGGPNGTPLFDGYLNGVGPAFTYLRTETTTTASVPSKLYLPTKVPHIVYMSENESRMYNGMKNGVPGLFPPLPPYTRRADSDAATDKFRFYEFPGTPHTDPVSQVLPINVEIVKAGGSKRATPAYYLDPLTGIQQEHDDLQLTEFFHGMQESIHAWAANGTPAPGGSTEWMWYATATDEKGNTTYDPLRDHLGNAMGGVRSPLIEVPLHRFYGQMQKDATTFVASSAGSMGKLPDTMINSLYGGSCANYLVRFNAAADALVRGRYLMEYEGNDLKAWAKTKGNTVVWSDGKTCN